VPAGDGWWSLVPIWESGQTPNPLRRWEPYPDDPWKAAAVYREDSAGERPRQRPA
jgi:hypothetical protein